MKIFSVSIPIIFSAMMLQSSGASNLRSGTSSGDTTTKPTPAPTTPEETAPPTIPGTASTTVLANYCGVDAGDALKCGVPCPGGQSYECPTGAYCYAGIPCHIDEGTAPPTNPGTASTTVLANYCGVDAGDALKCGVPCPGGQSYECPTGEYCYAGIPCPIDEGKPTVMANYCGSDAGDALKCGIPCPGGQSIECPSGEYCYAAIPCPGDTNITPIPTVSSESPTAAPTTSKPTTLAPTTPSDTSPPTTLTTASTTVLASYCGTDAGDALKCGIPCPGGQSYECPTGEYCYAAIPCPVENPVVLANYCGSDAGDALKCGVPCPGGQSTECPNGEFCYAAIPCSEGTAPPSPPSSGSVRANYCGLVGNWADAEKCQTACPKGLNSECPDGEACYAAIICP